MRIFVASMAAATAMGVCSGAPAMAANQAIILGGMSAPAMPDFMMAEVLGGMFGSYERQSVVWPQKFNPFLALDDAVDIGADNLHDAISQALNEIGPGEHVTVVGLSAGALVVDEELRRLAADPDAPDKSRINFVVAGDSSRFNFNRNRYDPILRYTYSDPPETKYDTTVVTAQYDGFADYPDRQWNVIAIANAIAGEMLLHLPSMFTDLSTVSPENVTVGTNSLGGVTTDYFLAADNLPLVRVMPLLVFGQSGLKDIVESAYIRDDNTAADADVPAPADAADLDAATVDAADADEPVDSAGENTAGESSDALAEEPITVKPGTETKSDATDDAAAQSDGDHQAAPKRKRARPAPRSTREGRVESGSTTRSSTKP